MTETIKVVINDLEEEIPRDVQTEGEILQEAGFDPAKYRLYRDEDVQTLGVNQRVGGAKQAFSDEPVVVSDGDEFVASPRYVGDGG